MMEWVIAQRGRTSGPFSQNSSRGLPQRRLPAGALEIETYETDESA